FSHATRAAMRHDCPTSLSSIRNLAPPRTTGLWQGLTAALRCKVPALLLASTPGLSASAALAEVSLTTAYTDASTAYFGDVRTLRITVTNSAEITVTDGALTVPDGSFVLPPEFEIA